MFTSQITVWLFDLICKSEWRIWREKKAKERENKVCLSSLRPPCTSTSWCIKLHRFVEMFGCVCLHFSHSLFLSTWCALGSSCAQTHISLGLRYIINWYSRSSSDDATTNECSTNKSQRGGENRRATERRKRELLSEMNGLYHAEVVFIALLIFSAFFCDILSLYYINNNNNNNSKIVPHRSSIVHM